MADYNVGKVKIGIEANADKTISQLDQVISKIEKINGLVGTKATSTTNKVNKSIDKVNKTTEKTKKSFINLFNVGKLYALYNYLKRFIQLGVKMVSVASDYAETLNKFEVSFGNLANENLTFINKLSKAYGFSSLTLMNYTSTFNNMLKSLSPATEEWDKLNASISRSLTQMAIDYSSLFNTSIESTMNAFQSALAGSIRPIRSTSGFDISETSIFSIYQNLGGQKTTRQLTQLEKRLLRIIAIQKQLEATGAVGDYYKTIENFANQARILKEQFQEFAVQFGKIFLVKLKPVIQYLNAILFTLNAIGEDLTRTIELEEDLNLDDEFAGFQSSTESATEAVDELNSSLQTLALDRLNVLGGSTSVASSYLDVDPTIMSALKEYTSNLDKVDMKAKKISRDMLTWLGYTQDINGEWKKSSGVTNLDKIVNSVKTIVSFIVSSKIISIITTIATKVKEISTITDGGKLATIGGKIGIITSIIVGLIAVTVRFYNTNERFRKRLNESLSSIFSSAKKIASYIKEIIAKLNIDFDWIIEYIGILISDSLEPLLNIIRIAFDLLTGNLDDIGATFESVLDRIDQKMTFLLGKEHWEKIKNFFKSIYDWIIGIPDLINQAGEYLLQKAIDIGMWIEETKANIVKKVKDIAEEIKKAFKDAVESVFGKLNEMVKGVKNSFKEAFEAVFGKLKEMWDWIADKFQKVKDFFGEVGKAVSSGVGKVGEVAGNVGSWFGNIGSSIGNWVKGIGSKIPHFANGTVATTPTVGLIGEYSGAKSNPEIVTPENKMREVFSSILIPVANAILSGNQDIVKAIQDKDINAYLDGRKVSEAIYEPLQGVAIRKGKK